MSQVLELNAEEILMLIVIGRTKGSIRYEKSMSGYTTCKALEIKGMVTWLAVDGMETTFGFTPEGWAWWKEYEAENRLFVAWMPRPELRVNNHLVLKRHTTTYLVQFDGQHPFVAQPDHPDYAIYAGQWRAVSLLKARQSLRTAIQHLLTVPGFEQEAKVLDNLLVGLHDPI